MLCKKEFSCMLLSAAELFCEEQDKLSDIDARFGDGDHGITVNKIGNVIKESVASWDEESISVFFKNLGDAIMAVNGGSAGPLYGTLIGGLGLSIENKSAITSKDLKAMFSSSLKEMQEITTARVGDKTMMDALIPAVEAANAAQEDIGAILSAAELGAISGAEGSRDFISKFGRAKSYKELTIGTPDAGAVSTALFFKGLSRGYTSNNACK